jgi:hypothetical protein
MKAIRIAAVLLMAAGLLHAQVGGSPVVMNVASSLSACSWPPVAPGSTTLLANGVATCYIASTPPQMALAINGGPFSLVSAAGPQGPPGQNGTNATITVGSVKTGTPAAVTDSGTPSAAVLNFVIPPGTPGQNGTNGTNGINGINGAAATVQVGSVTSGTPAAVANGGTSQAAVLNFVIPPGQQGAPGVVDGDTLSVFETCPSGTKGSVPLGWDAICSLVIKAVTQP